MKLSSFEHIFDRILDTAAFLAAAIVAFAMLAISAEVVIRYFIGETLTWVIDVSSILLLYMTFLSAAWLQRTEGHVIMDIVINRLNPGLQFFFNFFSSIVGALIFAALIFFGTRTTWVYFKMGYYMPTVLETPKFIVLAIIPIGSCLFFIQLLRNIYKCYKNKNSSALDKKTNFQSEA